MDRFYIFLIILITHVISIEVPSAIKNNLDTIFCGTNVENTTKCLPSSNGTQLDWDQINWYELPKPTLYCRQENLLTIKINSTSNELIYLIEIKTNTTDWIFWKQSTSNLIVLDKLNSSNWYQIRTWGVSLIGKLYGPTETDWMNTLSNNHNPEPPRNLNLESLLYDKNYYAIITWDPAEDMSCYYEFVWFGGDDISDYTQKEFRNPQNLFVMKIKDLVYSSNYSVAGITKSSDWHRESEKAWLTFTTLSCLDVHSNLNECVPETPTGLHVDEVLSEKSDNENILYNILLSWDVPNLLPQFYTAEFSAFQSNNNGSHFYANASGHSTKLFLKNVDVGLHYQISLFAWSPAGYSNPAILNRQVKPIKIPIKHVWDFTQVFFVVILPLISILSFITICLLIYNKINKKARAIKREQYFEELEMKAEIFAHSPICENPLPPFKDEWQICADRIILQTILGQGAFGVVRRGWLEQDDGKLEVAVKMLKEKPSFEETRQFEKEIEIMKSVGKHPNIVSMIGWCVKSSDYGICLIVEYCSRGDLLSFLKAEWEKLQSEITDVEYAELVSSIDGASPVATNFSNLVYLLDSIPYSKDCLQMKDLLSMARQISMGMEYLSNLRVVHRDLAARNILVCEDYTVKVSDFGLSRDVYKDNVYCKLGNGKVPIRWMAVESLTHQRYTTQSDVWSFGILLYEIVTLGGTPYPGIEISEVLNFIKSGQRMQCPVNCNQKLYNLMLNCWKANAKERPSFTQIRMYLDEILENTVDYIKLDAFHDHEALLFPKHYKQRSISSDKYVKPVSHQFS